MTAVYRMTSFQPKALLVLQQGQSIAQGRWKHSSSSGQPTAEENPKMEAAECSAEGSNAGQQAQQIGPGSSRSSWSSGGCRRKALIEDASL